MHAGEHVAVIGASLRDIRVYYIAVEDEVDLYLLINSKYIQSYTQGIYKKTGRLLQDWYWVLFSGCPCHIAGLYGYLGNKRDNEHLVTIEVVCHGIASPKALDIHLEHYRSSRIYTFRDKHQGTRDWKTSQCTTIDFNGKAVKLARKDDIFYSIYASWMMNRTSCSNCKFATFERVLDITIADFWGA